MAMKGWRSGLYLVCTGIHKYRSRDLFYPHFDIPCRAVFSRGDPFKFWCTNVSDSMRNGLENVTLDIINIRNTEAREVFFPSQHSSDYIHNFTWALHITIRIFTKVQVFFVKNTPHFFLQSLKTKVRNIPICSRVATGIFTLTVKGPASRFPG